MNTPLGGMELSGEAGSKALEEALEKYRRELYSYNSFIKRYGYYLKPMHIVYRRTKRGLTKYVYYGRYWYRVKYLDKHGGTSRVKWVYVGREKPDPRLPDPPVHPLDGLVVRVVS